jgi:geranylgeranyl diphosphate synthase type II
MDYQKQYEEYQSISEEGINKELAYYNGVPEPLISAMKYSINAGGKRLRPVLLLASCAMFGGNLSVARSFAAAVELIHTYSLIHDDMPCMDNDDFRRGLPTNHKVFGEGMALLAGDGLLNTAFEIILRRICAENSLNNIKAAVVIAEAAGCLGMAGGQSLDLYSENNPAAGEKELLYIHRHKTGSLISACLCAGAYIAGADEKEVNIIKEAGEELGVLFQITDDILDVTGSLKDLGKSVNKDNSRNKLTYIKIYGLEKSKELAAASAEKAIIKLKSMKADTGFFEQTIKNMLKRTK